jgi:flavin reductase (DIM6/NTAB) family NADH-FMN oxidoreductase RutF
LIKGAAMNAECKLLAHEKIGDHIMFVGEIIEITADENIKL